MSSLSKRRDGFQGEKLISLPQGVLKDALKRAPSLFQLFITHIGYFPKASAHYRERRKGCEDNILIYCLHGKGHFIIDNKKFEVTANQFIHVPATDKYMRYWADEEDPWTIYWIHFSGQDLYSFNNSLGISLLKGPQQIPFNQKALDIWETIYQSLEMGYSTENLCNASFCLYHFIATFNFIEKHILTEKKEGGNMIDDTILNMKSNIDQKLTVEDMARTHSLSSSHFSSLFRKGTGMSPIDYFIHLKMQKACQLLYSYDAMIKTVAMDLGYDDQYYFSRIFKKYMGMSPEQYRLTSKKGA
ncbi:MAG TPA: AraC family transcriptional regulator [Pedobacter sp.]|uniref:AraC family transcriptional regulator n=1 Tax=Pedobacter sp. TaxID=1411316 RepID=UPI002CC94089|nr:AraC family transcriptional regulator [Pedobacter sp.]HMI05181.1 AraC family transcriptional regulator [Pedobacter sp.]